MINVEEFLKKIDIADVISHYIDLEKKDNYYVGICPFHNDTNPSLRVTPAKNIYKCFVCSKGGNAINFVQNFLNIPYVDAIYQIANFSNIKLPERNEKKIVIDPKVSLLQEIVKTANDVYMYNLLSKPDDDPAWVYLASRNLTRADANTYQIGLAMNKDELTKILLSKNYLLKDILDAGIAHLSANSQVVDTFYQRITFALKDENGIIVGFSARTFTNQEPKYINSADSLIFKKSNVLYNYHNAKNIVHLSKKVYVVEGFMDAIALSKSGINNVVALMGTAFSTYHLNLLQNLKVEIIFALDNDSAGVRTSYKIIQELTKTTYKFKLVRPYKQKDSDELLQALGIEAVKKAFADSLISLDWAWDYLFANLDVQKTYDAKLAIDEMVKLLNNADLVTKQLYYNKIKNLTGVSVAPFIENKVIRPLAKYHNPNNVLTSLPELEVRLIKQALNYQPEFLETLSEKNYIFESPILRNIFSLLLDVYKDKTINVAILYDKLQDDVETKKCLDQLCEDETNRATFHMLTPEKIDRLILVKKVEYELKLNEEKKNATTDPLIHEECNKIYIKLRQQLKKIMAPTEDN